MFDEASNIHMNGLLNLFVNLLGPDMRAGTDIFITIVFNVTVAVWICGRCYGYY